MTDAQPIRGRLLGPDDAPPTGERAEDVAVVGSARVEQILSGALTGPVEYLQAHDEWVVVLAGCAELEVMGERHELAAGEWVLLPAGTPHRLVRAQPGTAWLAVHGDDAGTAPPAERATARGRPPGP
ncbi:MAG TPA: cupin domain-containing protein [Acidimicrobiales bacterium]|nr:cupin domain-containing protein [Acidimicrobiales bacterium]